MVCFTFETQMSTIALFLQCPCTPDKQYASAATMRAHQKSQRHRLYVLETELRDVRAQLAASEQARLELERLVRETKHVVLFIGRAACRRQ